MSWFCATRLITLPANIAGPSTEQNGGRRWNGSHENCLACGNPTQKNSWALRKCCRGRESLSTTTVGFLIVTIVARWRGAWVWLQRTRGWLKLPDGGQTPGATRSIILITT